MQVVRQVPDAAVYHGGWCYVDDRGNVLDRFPPTEIKGDPSKSLLQRNQFPCHASIVRRSAAEKAGLFKEHLRACEDWDFWIRVAAAGGTFTVVPNAFVMYRRYSGSMSTDHERMWLAGLTVLQEAGEALSASKSIHLASGIKGWRKYCYKRVLQGIHEAPLPEKVRTLVRAVVTDPGLLVNISTHLGGNIRRRISALVP